MRKFTSFILFILCLLLSNNAYSQRNSVKNGVGIIVGSPDTGISVKFLNSGTRHFNGAVAWTSKGEGSLHMHADYIFKKWRISSGGVTNFNTFVGSGVQLDLGKETFGIRIPLGVSYTFSEVPFDAYLEVVPGLGLVPDTDFNLDAAFAFRFLF